MLIARALTVAALVFPSALAAQREAPPHWQWTLDAPAQHTTTTDKLPAGTFAFVTMPPGWHVTMGPGGLLYDPRETAVDRFTLESRLFLFPGEPPAEYGVFVGGAELGTAAARWIAFVVRRDGSAAVLTHAQGRTEPVLAWTKHDAVKGGASGGANVVQVAVDTAVVFSVNGAAIASFPRGQLATDGGFGFRIGQGLNLHVTTLDITRRLAPGRP